MQMKCKGVITGAIILGLCLCLCAAKGSEKDTGKSGKENGTAEEKKYIKWVDFDVSAEALKEAARLDVESYESDMPVKWTELLALYAARSGGSFGKYKTGVLEAVLKEAREKSVSVESVGNSLENAKTYRYYKEAYEAVLNGMLGEYEVDVKQEDGSIATVKKYGIKAFSPIAKGYYYNDFDDFGASRSYGYKRKHLGHDMMGSVGTPIIAMESGYVEVAGWNQYGGWRIGIRSYDGKRYYYYAHLRKDHPFCDMYEGKHVTAGDVIGYLGMTGYSSKENVNNINVPHLHVGMELIFNPEQKDGYCQIWINMYELTQFLSGYRSAVIKDEASGEYIAAAPIRDTAVPD